jgi:nucleotide-binding universal stress UspA family protein
LVEKTAELLRSKGLKVTAAVEEGDPKSTILGAARDWDADLIVFLARMVERACSIF